jgi:hypothetical protein
LDLRRTFETPCFDFAARQSVLRPARTRALVPFTLSLVFFADRSRTFVTLTRVHESKMFAPRSAEKTRDFLASRSAAGKIAR